MPNIQVNTSLDELLNHVSYTELNNNYIPSQFALKVINFIKMVNGEHGEENVSPLFHYKILDAVVNNSSTLIVCFRGAAKTSLMEYLILYLAVFEKLDNFGDVSVMMYIGDSMDNGAKNLRTNVEHRYKNSEFLQKFIPEARFTDMGLEFTNANGHKLYVRLFGMSTGVRGFKIYGQRPCIALIDDIMSDKNAQSPTVTKDMSNTIYKAIRQALHPTKRKMLWCGTPFSKADPLYQAAGSIGWHTEVFPICEKFPCSKKEFIGAWEDRFPYKAVKEEYDLLKSTGKIDAFNQELMLRILSDEDRLVLDEDIIWYDRNYTLDNHNQFNWYITTDFATSETQMSDFSVISVWAIDYTGRFHWVDGIVKRQDMAMNVDDVFRFVDLYSPLSVGVEVSGQQKGFVSWLKREMTIRKRYFSLASDKSSGEEGLRPNTSKLARFNVVLPLFKQRKIAFPKELKESDTLLEFVDELVSITPSGFKSVHDDCIDTVSQLAMIEYFSPMDPKYNVNETKPVTSTRGYFYSDYADLEELQETSPYIV